METVTVFTNLTCNQRCGFCTFRRSQDEAGFASTERIARDIEAAAGAKTLVLSGGEPTLLPSLIEHVRHARRLGIASVVLETNAMMLAYPERALALADAGLTRVRVGLHAASAAHADAVSGTPGGLALTLRGMRNARDAGLEVEASIAITRTNLHDLPALPALCFDHRASDLLLRVVTDGEPRWTARYAEIVPAVTELAHAARERSMIARFDGRHGVPLCFFPERRRYPELFAGGAPREAHGFERIAACEGCAARERCPGVPASYRALHGDADAVAVPERHARFVAGLGRDRRQAVEDELINEAFFAQDGGGLERVIRVNFHCNQACGFCFVDRTLPSVSAERIEAEIRRAATDGVSLLSLSGGEPTLHPRLSDFVRMATSKGLRAQLQTNAIRCADPRYAAELVEAGLERAFISLHGATARVSDAITAAPGTFERTLLGIDNLLAAGVTVITNFVITGENVHELPAYARLVASRWAGAELSVNLSLAHASTDLVPRDEATIPRMSDVRIAVDEALSVLREASIPWRGFDGQCGIPLCLVGPDWLDVDALATLASPAPPAGFLKVEACARCELTDRCVGLRETYAALYGTAEIGGDAKRGKLRLPLVS
jgi:MoaA/NifB/PqqE/SkfB family radical SAM enzyme